MAITPRVKRDPTVPVNPPTDEAAIERVINRGLAQGSAADPVPAELDQEKKFTLRAPASTLKRIEDDARTRPGRVSVNTWLLEAIEEKFARNHGGGLPS